MRPGENWANGHKWPCPLFFNGNHGPDGPRAECTLDCSERVGGEPAVGIPFSSDDEGIDYPAQARELVYRVANRTIYAVNRASIYVVWFAYVRGNWKALVSTDVPDGRIYEVSYSAADGRTYVDSYLKTHNTEVDEFGQEVNDG